MIVFCFLFVLCAQVDVGRGRTASAGQCSVGCAFITLYFIGFGMPSLFCERSSIAHKSMPASPK